MRSLLTFLVLAIALLASNANAFTQISKKDAEICGKKNPDVVQAIAAFCQRAPYVSSRVREREEDKDGEGEEETKTSFGDVEIKPKGPPKS